MAGTTPLLATQAQLAVLSRAAANLSSASLATRMQALRASRSPDMLQQLQTEAILGLYDAVKQIQEAIWPLLLAIPDTSGPRQAADGQQPAATIPLNAGMAFRRP